MNPEAAPPTASTSDAPAPAHNGRPRNIWRWPRRDPLATSLAFCLVLLLGVIFALFWRLPETHRTTEQQELQEQQLQQKLARSLKWEAFTRRNVEPPVRVWDARTGKPIADLKNIGAVSSAWFSPDGKTITINGCERRVSAWQASSTLIARAERPVDHH